MLQIYAILVVALIWGTPTPAQTAQLDDPTTCQQFSSDLVRLRCYDTAFRGAPTSKPPQNQPPLVPVKPAVGQVTVPIPPQTPPSKWTVRTETSPIDDSSNVFLRLESDDMIRSRFGSPGHMVLHLHCRENTTMFYVYFNGLFMSDHQHGTVTYRLDDAKARTIRMRESNDHSALGLWRGNTSIPFVKALFGHDSLLIRATPHSESSVTATFTLTGLEEDITPLRSACNW